VVALALASLASLWEIVVQVCSLLSASLSLALAGYILAYKHRRNCTSESHGVEVLQSGEQRWFQ